MVLARMLMAKSVRKFQRHRHEGRAHAPGPPRISQATATVGDQDVPEHLEQEEQQPPGPGDAHPLRPEPPGEDRDQPAEQ
jgi:hypothetical protein